MFLEQLTYFKDLEIIPIEFLKEKYKDVEIKSFLEEETRGCLKKVLGE